MSDSKYPPRVTTNPGKVNPEPGKVTVTLTVEEAQCLHGEYIVCMSGDFLDIESRAQVKLARAIRRSVNE